MREESLNNISNYIHITPFPEYQAEKSSPENMEYVWSYRIRVENLSIHNIQIISRCWNIVDANGCIKEIKGTGIVGLQPIIPANGGLFEYSSNALLHTCNGIMFGNYEVYNCDTREMMRINIPGFALESNNYTNDSILLN